MSDLPAVRAIVAFLAYPEGEALTGVLIGLLLGLGVWALMLYREIGRRRRTEAALRQEQDRLRQTLAAACDASWELDAENGVFSPREAWRSMLGYGPRQDADTVRTFEALLHPEDRPRLQEAVQAVVRGDAPGMAVEIRLMNAAGQWQWTCCRGAPILRDGQGRVLRLGGGLTDIHARKDAAAACRAGVRKLDAVLKTLPLHLYWKDAALRLDGCNGWSLLDQTAPLRQDACSRAWQPDPRRELLERQVLATGVPVLDLHEVTHPETGEGHTVQVHLLPLPGDGPQPGGVLGMCHDVTQRLALERDLQFAKQKADAANLAKSRLLAAMSHEIRTPMNAILGMAEMLRETRLDREQEGFVQVLTTSGESLMAIINNILDFSRAESGQMQPEHAPFRPAEVLTRLRDLFALRCQTKGLRLEFILDPALPDLLLGDALRLQQILSNLLENAVKFTSAGSLRVQATLLRQQEQGAEVLFEVADTGPGIPESRQQAVFEHFVQVDESTTRQYGGSGLGLALCRELARLLGGQLWLESEVGQGSTFFLALGFGVPPSDMADSASAAARRRPSAPGVPATADTCHVLLVEDSEFNAFVVASYLKGTACRVTIASNGEEGLKAYAKGTFDVVLMDMQMPVMDGYTATRAIRDLEAAEGLPVTPVLAMTAHAMDEQRERSLTAGCSAHLAKPVSRRDLLQAIARFTGKQVLRGAAVAAESLEIDAGSAGMLEALPPQDTCPIVEADAIMQDGSPIPVCVDPELKDLAPTFLQAIQSKISPFRRALLPEDMEALSRLGHQLKGEGAAFGFPILGELGAQLEGAALRGDSDGAAAVLDRLQDVLDRIVMV
ncbi:hybrid sensor histidine kinase/response regulator [Megalodesulfovibrio gigas]|nr:hybrid sensor histidine kinase/response regulator [Megalodesulfovibrio gigas]